MCIRSSTPPVLKTNFVTTSTTIWISGERVISISIAFARRGISVVRNKALGSIACARTIVVSKALGSIECARRKIGVKNKASIAASLSLATVAIEALARRTIVVRNKAIGGIACARRITVAKIKAIVGIAASSAVACARIDSPPTVPSVAIVASNKASVA